MPTLVLEADGISLVDLEEAWCHALCCYVANWWWWGEKRQMGWWHDEMVERRSGEAQP